MISIVAAAEQASTEDEVKALEQELYLEHCPETAEHEMLIGSELTHLPHID
jgi:hypothetical protein